RGSTPLSGSQGARRSTAGTGASRRRRVPASSRRGRRALGGGRPPAASGSAGLVVRAAPRVVRPPPDGLDLVPGAIVDAMGLEVGAEPVHDLLEPRSCGGGGVRLVG